MKDKMQRAAGSKVKSEPRYNNNNRSQIVGVRFYSVGVEPSVVVSMRDISNVLSMCADDCKPDPLKRLYRRH